MSAVSSMTGFAAVKVPTEFGILNIDIRSVNSRFLDLSIRAPEEVRSFEADIRELVTKNISRGKVEWRFNFEAQAESILSSVSPEALDNLMACQAEVLKKVPEAARLSVNEILNFPGLLKTSAADEEAFKKELLEGCRKCLEIFIESRRREGASLKSVLLGYCDKIDELVDDLIPEIPVILENQKNKLTERLDEALTAALSEKSPLSAEEIRERIRQEVILYGIKIDVNEELERLKTHVKEVRRTLEAEGTVGKRLDFLMQEMNRESNTLGSKAAAIAMTDTSVNLKLVIESMREQIQNLE